jgi:ketosteroid isomerase-like protein
MRAAWEHFITTGQPAQDMTDDDVVVYDHDIMDGEVYRGHAGVSRWLSDWATAWSHFSLDTEEFLDAGESVVVVFQLKAKGARSGVEVARQDAVVFAVRNAKMVRIDYFNSRDQALKAVGLEG